MVLHLDMRIVLLKDVKGTFNQAVNSRVKRFSDKYVKAGLLNKPVEVNPNSYLDTLDNFSDTVEDSGHFVFLIVDETDSFANRLLVQIGREAGLGKSAYREFVKREGSVLRDFGRAIKAEGCYHRMFFTGLMPVAWSDAFSSLNIVKDVTHHFNFSGALGFTSADIQELLAHRFPNMNDADRGHHLNMIQLTCNGYRRSSHQEEAMYNPQGVWYYLDELKDKGENMVASLDPNIVPSARDEIAAFLVQQAIGILVLSIL